ncbi:hypothetical protein NMY22_g2315 [Coprinellus aureogranulatus]|nr:hypothetical protein NMY22_g2315 [Coprinellus aureogranulatus]
MRSFLAANQPQFGTDQSAFYGPYTRLLYYLFDVLGPYDAVPRFHTPSGQLDVEATFTVEFYKYPIPSESKPMNRCVTTGRRGHFRDLRQAAVTPHLPGVSAFGTRLRFYENTVATNGVAPAAVPPDPLVLNDLAPVDRWDCDLLDADDALTSTAFLTRSSSMSDNVADINASDATVEHASGASEPLRLLPAAGSSSDASGATKLDVGEQSNIKLDALGPMVVNSDGVSVSLNFPTCQGVRRTDRFNEWATDLVPDRELANMTELERERTLRVLGARNK